MKAVFTIARKWKQPKYPSTESCKHQLGYSPTVECCTAIKNNKFMLISMHTSQEYNMERLVA